MIIRKYFICLRAVLLMFIFLFFIHNCLALSSFYIFKDYKAVVNHFLSVIKTGDSDNIIYEIQNKDKDNSFIKILYRPTDWDKYGWSSISWAASGDEKEFYDIAEAGRVAFQAKGGRGREIVQFETGSISETRNKATSASTGAIILTDTWQEYSIDLEGVDLSSLKVAFSLTINKIDNLNGADIYLDEIKYEFWDNE